MARMSCAATPSTDSIVPMICTSLRKPLGQSGRIGRSTMRALSVAFSEARPSRLKKPPGILPAAYIFSSMSTVSGKKSVPSRASVRPTAVASTTRVAAADGDCAVRLSGQLAGREGDLLAPDVDRDGDLVELQVRSCSFPASSVCCIAAHSDRGRPARSCFMPAISSGRLAAEAELADQLAVGLEVVPLEVLQEAAPAPDQRSAARAASGGRACVPQVLGELVDASASGARSAPRPSRCPFSPRPNLRTSSSLPSWSASSRLPVGVPPVSQVTAAGKAAAPGGGRRQCSADRARARQSAGRCATTSIWRPSSGQAGRSLRYMRTSRVECGMRLSLTV